MQKYKYNKLNNSVSVEDMERMVLSNGTMSDIEKLKNIFELRKNDIRNYDVNLYYAILGVLDSNKKPDPGNYFD